MRILAIFCTLGAALASAADPQVLTIEESSGRLSIPLMVTEYFSLPRDVTVVENGRTEVRTIHEKVPVTTPWPTIIDAGAGDFLDRAGRPMDPRAVARLLKPGTVIVVSTAGTSVGPEPLKKNEKIAAILMLKPLDQFKPSGAQGKRPAPHIGTVEKDRDGSLHVEATVTEFVPVQEARTKRVGGRIVTETVTVQVTRTYKMRHALADATVTDLGGNPVSVKTLRPGSRVAVSADLKPVDPGHLNELKGVVAVVVPREVLP